GEETDLLGEEAKRYGAYILVQAKAKLPEFPDTYFNAQFLIKPDGKPFAQPNGRPYMHCKNLVCTLVEPSTTPHDVYDRWVEVFGDGLDAFFPVARTPDIGNIGSCICAEKNALPESFRALTLNGAEVIYAPAAIERPTDIYEAICRARAADYCCYILAPNVGRHYLDREGKRVGFATGGGHASYMIDPLGTVIGRTSHETDTWIIGTIDIEYLRGLRSRIWYGPASFKVEIFKGLFKQSIYPRGFKPRSRAEVSEIRRRVIQKLAEEGRLGVP
ncbi:MAG: nitrilase-related carbon-nitrogen hydrolase, partial [Candidatus Bathyarchaeia archaeon]